MKQLIQCQSLLSFHCRVTELSPHVLYQLILATYIRYLHNKEFGLIHILMHSRSCSRVVWEHFGISIILYL